MDKTHVISVAPPDWWGQHSTQTIEERYRPYQVEVLEGFGLTEPVAVEEQDGLVCRHERGQKRKGRALLLEYGRLERGEERSRSTAIVIAFSGSDELSQGGASRSAAPAENRALYQLARRSEQIQYETGATPIEAVDLLLSGIPFVFPWVTTSIRIRSGVVDLRVGSPVVPLDDVRHAYADAIEYLRQEQPETLKAAPRRRRRRRGRTVELARFVDEHSPGQKTISDWERLRTEWREAHPDQKPFPTAAAVREAYRRAKKAQSER